MALPLEITLQVRSRKGRQFEGTSASHVLVAYIVYFSHSINPSLSHTSHIFIFSNTSDNMILFHSIPLFCGIDRVIMILIILISVAGHEEYK